MTGTELPGRGCGEQGVVVTLRGELDMVNAARAVDAILAAAAGGGRVIVDLSAVEFIDCCALRALASAQSLARRGRGDVILASPREPVRRLLDLTGLAEAISAYDIAPAAACPGSEHAARQAADSASLPERAASLRIDAS